MGARSDSSWLRKCKQAFTGFVSLFKWPLRINSLRAHGALVQGRAEQALLPPPPSQHSSLFLELEPRLGRAVLPSSLPVCYLTTPFPVPCLIVTMPTVFPRPEPASQDPHFDSYKNTITDTVLVVAEGAPGCPVNYNPLPSLSPSLSLPAWVTSPKLKK